MEFLRSHGALKSINPKLVVLLSAASVCLCTQAALAQYRPNSAWPTGYVPFEFDPTVTQEQRQLMLGHLWLLGQSGANINFVYRYNNEVPYMLVTGHDGANAPLGRSSVVGLQVPNGANQISIHNNGGWTATWVIVHELMHLLGFHHEHTRPDRDTYVTVRFDHIAAGQSGNFTLNPDDDIVGPYDYTSIMHYDGCNDSTCTNCSSDDPDCRVITTLDPDYQSVIGLLDEWGVYDRAKLQTVYGVGRCAYAQAPLAGGVGSLASPTPNLMIAANLAGGGTVWCRRGSVFTSAGTLAIPATYKVHDNGMPVILN